ncbi:hypothetical protein [Rhodopirellula bahusiensis]|uniref:hypothetical protein n=1 Tax=Rhodopirellula bahusiensis TaxID=2014065 RepID=UPI003265D817
MRESGYLSLGKNDADVASPENYDKIGKLIDAMIDVCSFGKVSTDPRPISFRPPVTTE